MVMFNSQPFIEHKDSILVKTKQVLLTYDDVFRSFMSWAYFLKKVAPTGNLALAMPNCVESHVLFLAALQCHNIIMFDSALLRVSPDLIDRLDIDHLLTFDESLVVNSNKILIKQHEVLSYKVDPVLYPTPTDNTMVLISNGTSGTAKAVKFNSEEILGYSKSLLTKTQITASDCLYNMLPYHRGFGLIKIFSAIETGSSYYIPDSADYKNVIEDINRHGCTWVCAVPNLARIMIKGSDTFHSRFRFIMVGGDLVSAELCRDFRNKFGINLLADYGLTEGATVSVGTLLDHRDGAVGKIDPSTVKFGEDNEIFVSPKWFTDGRWVATGDVGELDQDGFLWFKSRKKDIIKRQGKTIYPAELESHLEKLTGTTELVVYNDGKNNKGDRIGIVYSGSITEKELKDYCTANLPVEYYPNRIIRLDEIPMFNNKISRAKLKDYVDQLQ